ncbi:hypothetical protein CFAM422_008560 [Trichoderma lentiforme]|uniref:Uncharacterized protein n=1 Tax=Trichoderma lentiforme TaxID=1567552 RepID=A0A9P4XA51_9HYPO|nr:hypothetical protein CFAM422_008560 [Trichoderma lentiforme]
MLALFRPSPLLRSMSSGIASPKLGPGSGWLAGPNEAAQASRWMRLTLDLRERVLLFALEGSCRWSKAKSRFRMALN